MGRLIIVLSVQPLAPPPGPGRPILQQGFANSIRPFSKTAPPSPALRACEAQGEGQGTLTDTRPADCQSVPRECAPPRPQSGR